MAPEERVKAKVRATLAKYQDIWTFWPVQTGRGRRTVDLLACYRGHFFVVETKAPGKKPTILQVNELQAVGRAMGRSFVISSVNDPVLEEMKAWLDNLTEAVDYAPYQYQDPVDRRPVQI